MASSAAVQACPFLGEVVVSRDTIMEDFCTRLLPVVRPAWRGVELEGRILEGGVTNTLVAIFEKQKGLQGSREEVVLVRLNGTGSEKVISRRDEMACLLALHQEGLCPSLHAQFSNGLCYGFFPGRQVGVAEVREEEMSGKIARLLARLHCTRIPQHFSGRLPQLWAKIAGWFTELPQRFKDEDKQKRFEEVFVSMEAVKGEVSWLQGVISSSCQSPIVFCHNDTLIANFIYDEITGDVQMVDYEYGGPNYLAFDIANHFCEFSGIEVVDFDLYPDTSFQKKWLRKYLLERARLTGAPPESVSQDTVDSLYSEVQKFALSSHLFWSVGSLLQSQHSTTGFDYMQYAMLKYREYLRRKGQWTKNIHVVAS